MSHREHLPRGLQLNSENRGEPWAVRLERKAAAVEALGSSDRFMVLWAKAGLEHVPDPPELTPDSWELARYLAVDAANRLCPVLQAQRVRISDLIPDDPDLPDEYLDLHPPVKFSSDAWVGLSLLSACNNYAIERCKRLTVRRAMAGFEQLRDNANVRLAWFIAAEARLWMLAGEHGARSSRIPYASLARAQAWFWSTDAHKRGLIAPAVCLRCGVPWIPRGPIKTSPPRCPHCAKESPVARKSPQLAIAPAGRGDWWLRCETVGCPNVCSGHAQRRKCPACDSSRLDASRRRPPRVVR